jgi:hypothetical protein
LSKKAWAMLRLALCFVRHWLRFPFVTRRGLQALRHDYASDGVNLVLPNERATAAATTRCTGCGRCDSLVAEGDPPSLVLLRSGRESADAAFIARRLRALAPYAQAIRAICPENVDVPALILRVERLVHEES